MSYIYMAKCSRCEYSTDYKPDMGENYYYRGLSKHSKYPLIRYAWCNDCRKFVPVQLGINAELTKSAIQSHYKNLLELEKSIIKPVKTRIEIELTKNKLFDAVILNALTGGIDTHTSCVLCGSYNVVFKDIENQIWRCPKCKTGFLVLEKENDDDDVLLRRGEKIIVPRSHFYDIIPKIVHCAIDMISNEGVYYGLRSNAEMLSVLTRKTSYIDRIALIYAILVMLLNKQIPKEPFVLDIIEHLSGIEFVERDIKHLIVARLDERIEYFKSEIEIELECSAFIPSAIIKTLMNPTQPPTRTITGINPLEAINHWKIIIDTTYGYFYDELIKSKKTNDLK